MTSPTARAKASAGEHDPRHPAHVKLTPQQLHDRAVERQVILNHQFKAASVAVSKHELVRMFDRRPPHALRSTAERPHHPRTAQREHARAAYWRGIAFNEMGKTANGKRSLAVYAHSSAKQEAPAMAMAA